MARAPKKPQEPKFAMELASYPAFRIAFLEFREFTRETSRGQPSPNIDSEVRSTDYSTRNSGFLRVANKLAPLLLAAHMWRIDAGVDDYSEQVLRAMAPCVDWVTRVMNFAREPFPAVRFGAEVKGDNDKMIRATAENVPPCWSPRGRTKTSRELLSRTQAEMFAAQLSNYMLELLEAIDLESAAKVKSQLALNPELAANPDKLSEVYTSSVLGRKYEVGKALDLFLHVARDRVVAEENINKTEAAQIKALAEAAGSAKDAAFKKLDAMKVMLSPEEQRRRAEEAFLKVKAAEEQAARRLQDNQEMSNFGPSPLSITSTKPNPRGYFR